MNSSPHHNEIIFYNTPTGDVKIEVIFNDETFWLTQKRMAELFGVEVPAISKHLANILKLMNYKRKQLFPFWKQFNLKAVKV